MLSKALLGWAAAPTQANSALGVSDFGVGDAVHPQPQVIEYPVLKTNSPIRLHAYPVEGCDR